MTLKAPLKLAGPGTVAMIVCVILLSGWNLLRPTKVRIERQLETSGEKVLERKPDPSLLLRWKDHLGLSSSQISQLKNLNGQREHKLAPITAEIKETMSTLQSSQGQSSGQINIGQLTAVASQIKTPSRQLRALEVSFSEQGWSVLSEKQKNQALSLKHASSRPAHIQTEVTKP